MVQRAAQWANKYYSAKMAVSAASVRTFAPSMAVFRVFLLLGLLIPLLGQAQRPMPPATRPPQIAPAGPRVGANPPPAKGSPIKLLTAGELVGGDFNGVKIRKLITNVSFQQDDVFLYCDSAYQYL